MSQSDESSKGSGEQRNKKGVVQFRPFSGNTGERERTAQAGGLESCKAELRRV